MTLRNAHLVAGASGVVLFILQGQYMGGILNVPELDDGARLMYRSSHIYLMLASISNLFVGCYMPLNFVPGLLQRIASALLLLAPVMILAGFVAESEIENFERPITAFALYFIFAAAMVLLTAELLRRRRSGPGS